MYGSINRQKGMALPYRRMLSAKIVQRRTTMPGQSAICNYHSKDWFKQESTMDAKCSTEILKRRIFIGF